MTLILGIATVILSSVFFVIYRRLSLSVVCGVCFAMILLYQARFMIDLVPETFARTKEWLTDGTYGEMTYTYQVADVLKEEVKKNAILRDVTPPCHPEERGTECRASRRATCGVPPQDDILSVATCKDSATALGYLLHPISVRVEEESWEKATHAVVTLYPWEEIPETFTCHDITRSASVVKQFPTGDAVIRFTENPT